MEVWGVCSFLWGWVGQREGERDICGTAIGSLLPKVVSTFSAGGVARALRGINNLDCTRLPFCFPSDHNHHIHQVTKLRYMYIYDENEDDDNDDGDDNNHNLIKQKKDFLSRVDGKSGPMVAKSQVHRGNNLEPLRLLHVACSCFH